MEKPAAARNRPGSAARWVATLLFGLIVATLTTVFSLQIISQAWNRDGASTTADCRDAVHSMLESLNRARQSAAAQTGELAALSAFRAQLRSAWRARGAVEDLCRADPEASRLLVDLVSLRFSEEHAVRYEAREVAVQRRNVEAMARNLFDRR